MEELPFDALVSLLTFLSRPALLAAAQVSRTLLAAASDHKLWADDVACGTVRLAVVNPKP
jgi:hypothetical protein